MLLLFMALVLLGVQRGIFVVGRGIKILLNQFHLKMCVTEYKDPRSINTTLLAASPPS